MAQCGYAKYVITRPKFVTELARHNFTDISGFTFPDEVYLDKELFKEGGHWLEITFANDNACARHRLARLVLED